MIDNIVHYIIGTMTLYDTIVCSRLAWVRIPNSNFECSLRINQKIEHVSILGKFPPKIIPNQLGKMF